MKTNLKKVFENAISGSWQIVCVKQAKPGQYFVKAKTRFFNGFDGVNSFDGYFSEKYLAALCKEYFGKRIHDMNSFTH